MFEVTVNTRRAVVGTKELITTSSAGIQVQFTFSEDWDELSKIAIFRNGDEGQEVAVALPNSNLTVIPAQSCSEDFVDEPLFVGVYGTDGLGAVIIPTVWTSLGVLRPGAVTTDIITPPEPTPDMWAQILAIANEAAAIADECEANEELRVAAEQLRAGAETARANAEALRAAAEDARAENENQRQGAETQRQAAEDARAQAEALRIQAEELRQTNETSRVSAEIDRASAEQTRQTNEATRASNEAARVTAEQNRASAETQRASAESSRVTEETSRVSAESSRATAEQDRASAETARASAESQRVTAENNRVSAEQNRVNAEDERAQAETDRAAEFANWESNIASKVPNTRTVNGKALSTDITLDAGDIGYDSTGTYQAGSVGAELQEQNRQLNDETTGLDTKAPVIINSASGAIASFDDGADNMPVRKLVAQIEPVQDLHGYDHPWPAGGNINKFSGQWPPDASSTYAGWHVEANTTVELRLFDKGNGADISGLYFGLSLNGTQAPVAWGIDAGQLQFQSVVSRSTDTYFYKYVTLYPNNEQALIKLLNRFDVMVTVDGADASTFAPYSNICPISGHTGAEIEQTGVNVWDEEFEHGNINNSTGELVPDTSLYRSKNVIPVKGDSVYYLATNSNYNAIIYWYDKEMNYLGYIDQTANSTRTAPSNAYYARLRFFSNVTNMEKGHFSINYPATATSYVPYTGNQISVNWEDEAGTVYGGTLTLNSDGTVDLANSYRYFTAPLEGVPMYQGASADIFFWYTDWNNPGNKCKPQGNVVCSIYPSGHGNGMVWLGWAGNYGNCLVIQDNSVSTVEEMLAKIDGAEFAYELNTPVTYHLDNVGQLYTFLGTNNIWASTGDTEVEYPCDTKLYIDGKLAELQATILENIGG